MRKIPVVVESVFTNRTCNLGCPLLFKTSDGRFECVGFGDYENLAIAKVNGNYIPQRCGECYANEKAYDNIMNFDEALRKYESGIS